MKNSQNLKFTGVEKVNPILRKKNRIKTLAGTLEIEGNFLGEKKSQLFWMVKEYSEL